MEISQTWILKSWPGEEEGCSRHSDPVCSLTGLEQHLGVGVVLQSPGVELAEFLECSVL